MTVFHIHKLQNLRDYKMTNGITNKPPIPLTPRRPGGSVGGLAQLNFAIKAKNAKSMAATLSAPSASRHLAAGLPPFKIDLSFLDGDDSPPIRSPASSATTPSSAGSRHSYRYHAARSPAVNDIGEHGMQKNRKKHTDGANADHAYVDKDASSHHYSSRSKRHSKTYRDGLAAGSGHRGGER